MRITETLQVLSDSTRLRMLRLLAHEELSVAELQEILEMGQSRISSHLGLLRRHDMVSDRKDGKKTYYTLNAEITRRFELIRVALTEQSEESFWETDQSSLARIVDRRRRATDLRAVEDRQGPRRHAGLRARADAQADELQNRRRGVRPLLPRLTPLLQRAPVT